MDRKHFLRNARIALKSFIEIKRMLLSKDATPDNTMPFDEINSIQEQAAVAISQIDDYLNQFIERKINDINGAVRDIFHSSLAVYEKNNDHVINSAIAGLRLAISKVESNPDYFFAPPTIEKLELELEKCREEQKICNKRLDEAEKKNSDLINQKTPYLDKTHKYYSPKLEACVSVFMALLENEQCNPTRGIKQQIKNWIASNRPEVAGRDDLIARVVSPDKNKNGGCPPNKRNVANKRTLLVSR